MSQELIDDIRDRLIKQLKFKRSGKYLRGTCPSCNEKEKAWTWHETPLSIRCSRNSCDAIAARELYPDLFEEFSDRYPATEQDPNATARHYLSDNRGLNISKLNAKLWTQATRPTPCGQAASTVRFKLWGGHYWERIIDNSKAALMKDGRKAHFSYGIEYANKHWAPREYTPTLNSRIFIVEGIFHAIALDQEGTDAIAAFSCNNFPWDFVNKHKGQGVIWCLAFDNGEAGRENILKYRAQLTAIGEASEIHLCVDDKIDWDAALRAGLYRQNPKEEKDQARVLKFWQDCAYRGNLLGASSPKEYAYFEYCQRSYTRKVIVFNKKHHAVKVDYTLSSKLSEDNIDISSDKGRNLFESQCSYKTISNCHIEMLYRQRDIVFRDQQCVLRLSYAHKKQIEFIEIKGGAFTAVGKFRDKLADQTTATFSGESEHLDWMYEKWMLDITDIDVQPYVGYNAEHKAWVFPKQGFVNNRLQKITKENYYPLSRNQGIRTSLESIPFSFGKDYDKDLGKLIFQIWGAPGLIALAGFTAALFTDQLKKHYGDWPFIEIYGEPGGGKTTLIKILWKMLGRTDEWEGIDVAKTRPAGRAALFAQLSNMPAVVIESDHADDKSFSWGEFKDYYGHRAVIRGRGTTEKLATDNLQFLGTLFFVQNSRIETDHEAIIERLVGCFLKRGKKENVHIADKLKDYDLAKLNGYITAAITKEQAFIGEVIKGTKHYTEQLHNDEYPKRIVENHARILAAIRALNLLLPIDKPTLDICANYMADQLQERAARLGADHPDVAEYWDTVEYLEAQAINADFRGESTEQAPSFEENRAAKVDHSSDPNEIWIWPKQIEELARKRGQQVKAFKDLRVLITQGRVYKFIGQGKRHSPLLGKTVQLYRFKRAGKV